MVAVLVDAAGSGVRFDLRNIASNFISGVDFQV
jgi:hypothetical protein